MKYIFFDSIDSTNNEAKRTVTNGSLTESTCFVAKKQTSGRGRCGKSFYSPESGLYMTAVFPVNIPISSQVTMTTRSAVAVCEAINEATGMDCDIKWVNDIYIHGRKCCGILCEAINDYDKEIMKYMIIGIGINILNHTWPEELKNIATALFDDASSLPTSDFRTVLAEKIAGKLEKWLFLEPFDRFYSYYRSHSMVLDKEITFTEGNIIRSGKAIDIAPDGGLVITTTDCSGKPETITLSSGEISIRLN